MCPVEIFSSQLSQLFMFYILIKQRSIHKQALFCLLHVFWVAQLSIFSCCNPRHCWYISTISIHVSLPSLAVSLVHLIVTIRIYQVPCNFPILLLRLHRTMMFSIAIHWSDSHSVCNLSLFHFRISHFIHKINSLHWTYYFEQLATLFIFSGDLKTSNTFENCYRSQNKKGQKRSLNIWIFFKTTLKCNWSWNRV